MPRARERMDVEDQLCFALYAASRAMTARYRPYLDQIGLTYPQFLVMIVLWDEGAATVSQIGERLRLDSGTLSPLLKRLEASELITRSRVPHDDRAVLIEASAKGHRLRGEGKKVLSEISSSLSHIDHGALVGVLLSLEESLRAGL